MGNPNQLHQWNVIQFNLFSFNLIYLYESQKKENFLFSSKKQQEMLGFTMIIDTCQKPLRYMSAMRFQSLSKLQIFREENFHHNRIAQLRASCFAFVFVLIFTKKIILNFQIKLVGSVQSSIIRKDPFQEASNDGQDFSNLGLLRGKMLGDLWVFVKLFLGLFFHITPLARFEFESEFLLVRKVRMPQVIHFNSIPCMECHIEKSDQANYTAKIMITSFVKQKGPYDSQTTQNKIMTQCQESNFILICPITNSQDKKLQIIMYKVYIFKREFYQSLEKMQIMRRMNQKLDIGWKMTNSSCQKCNGVTMADPNDLTKYYCPKCDQQFQFHAEQGQQPKDQMKQKDSFEEEERYYNQVISETGMFGKPTHTKIAPNTLTQQTKTKQIQDQYKQVQQKNNNVSKKLGEKLMQGWTMLQQACMDCNVPLMRSKRGEKICFGCQKDYAKIQQQSKQQKLTGKQTVEKKNSQKSKPVQNSPDLIKQTQTTNKKQLIPRNNNEQSDSQNLIEDIQCKALRFLQDKMDKAITDNDISSIQRILSIVKNIKN